LSSVTGEQCYLARSLKVSGRSYGLAEVGANGDDTVMGNEDCVSLAEAVGEILS